MNSSASKILRCPALMAAIWLVAGCASTGGAGGAGLPGEPGAQPGRLPGAAGPASSPNDPGAGAGPQAKAGGPEDGGKTSDTGRAASSGGTSDASRSGDEGSSSDPAATTGSGARAPAVPDSSATRGTRSGSGPSVPPRTPEERRAAVDRELDASLGQFDAQVRKEQARIAREREDRRTARSGDAQGGPGEEGTGAGEGRGDRGARDRRGNGDLNSDMEGQGGTSARRPGDLKSDKQGGGGSGPGSVGKGPSSVPPGVGTGEDDDLVARQLREAAEKETDPELREKLWKEYQDYKSSVKR